MSMCVREKGVGHRKRGKEGPRLPILQSLLLPQGKVIINKSSVCRAAKMTGEAEKPKKAEWLRAS